MIENLILFLIMLLYILMRLLALGIQLILKCLKGKLQMWQNNPNYSSLSAQVAPHKGNNTLKLE
jgi:hypothetical protein